jgi:hypothetical protein
MIRIKRGAAFDFTGQLTNAGAPYPLAGAQLFADVRQATYFTFVQHMRITVVDEATSLVNIYAPGVDTAKWLAMPHLMDVRLVKPDGKPLVSNTVVFEVLDSVTQEAATT